MTVGGGRHRISTGGDDEPRAAAARAAAARAAASRAALSSPVLGITAVTRDTTIYQQQQLQQLQDEQIAKALKATPGVALALQRQQAYHAAATTYHDAAASAPADELAARQRVQPSLLGTSGCSYRTYFCKVYK